MTTLKISFSIAGRYSNPAKLDQEMDIIDLANYYAGRFQEEEGSSTEHVLRTISNGLLLQDRKGEIHNLSQIWYKPWQFDRPMFVAAHIIEMNQYKKNVIHLLCEYEDSGNIYKGCFVVPEDRYLEAYEHNKHNCLIGTCVRKKYKASGHYSYNKFAHSGNVSQGEEKKTTKMLHFYMF